MTRSWAAKLATGTLLLAAVLQAVPASANGERHHPKRYTRITYVDPAHYADYCRLGWWQTLRYGHVRPYWGIRCH